MPGSHLNMAHEFAMGHKAPMMMLYGMVQRQAMMLSFNDVYRILCVLMMLLVPTFLFLKRDTRNLPAEASH
jgi:Ca2+/H+ antiporter